MNLDIEGTKDRITYLLAEYKTGIYLATAAGIALYATGELQMSVPKPIKLMLLGITIGIVPSVAIGKWLAERWLPDPRVQVIQLDPDGPAIEPYRVPRDLWDDREVEELPVWQISEGTTEAVVTEIEETEDDGLRVRGLNPELADPISIAARDGKLSEIFGELVEQKRDYQALKGSVGLKQIEIEDRAINEIVRAIEQGSSIDPGAMDEIVEPEEFERSDKPDQHEVEDGDSLRDILDGEETVDPLATDGGEQQ